MPTARQQYRASDPQVDIGDGCRTLKGKPSPGLKLGKLFPLTKKTQRKTLSAQSDASWFKWQLAQAPSKRS